MAGQGATSVVVVGAGIIGAAVAWELARRGVRVTVVDAREPGEGATQASAGMLAPFTEARATSAFEALCAEGLDVYDGFVAALRDESRTPFEYVRNGSVEVALDEDGAAHLQGEVRRLAATAAARARWMDAAAVAAEEPALSPIARGALVLPTQGVIGVPGFTAALIEAAIRRGVTLRSRVPVARVQRAAQGYVVSGPDLTIGADTVVLCTGSWTGRIDIGRLAPSVRPIRGQLLYLRPRLPLFSRILWGPRCYLVPWADGTVLVGATVEDVGFDEQTTASGVAALLAAAVELVPALAGAAFMGVRAGLRPLTSDELPVIGAFADAPGLVLATGHYRNGALLAPLTARIVGDLVAEGRQHPALASFGPERSAAPATTQAGA